MSHGKERKERACLNCGEVVAGHYCQNCGQENIEPNQSVWHLVTHFFNDITHFDGKFFSTMKLLLFKPGLVSDEYVHGRRTKYLDPVRMYLFISALFFLSFGHFMPHIENLTMQDRDAMNYIDSLRQAEGKSSHFGFYLTSVPDLEKQVSIMTIDTNLSQGVAHYMATQQKLPKEKRDEWIDVKFKQALIGVYHDYEKDPYNFVPNVINRFIKSLTKIFFISLPLFALLLHLLYIRKRTEKKYYVSHAIFSIHFYSVSFIFLFIMLALVSPETSEFSEGVSTWIIYITALGMLVYLLIAMHRFYKQGWIKTFIKTILLSASATMLIFIITIVLLINSFITH